MSPTIIIHFQGIKTDFAFETSSLELAIKFLVFMEKADSATIERINEHYTKMSLDEKSLTAKFWSTEIAFTLSRKNEA